MREVVNGLMYVLSTGCQWRAIPKDLPPKSTVYDYFDLWTYDGTLQRIHYALYDQCREGIAITLPPWMAQASATAAAEQSCAEPIRASVGSPTRRLLSPPSGEYANHRHAVLLAPRQQITLDASAVEAVTDLIGRAPTAVSKTEEIFHIADIEVGDAPSTNLPRGAQGLERRLSVPGEGPRGRPRLGRRGAVYAPSPSQRNRSDSLPKPFELPEVRAVVRATRLYCQNARNAQKFTPVRGSSGEPG